MATSLADTTTRLLADLPPYEQSSRHIQGTLDACAREVDRLDAAVLQVRNNFFPSFADILLVAYEQELGLTVNPANKSIDERRNTVQAFMRKLRPTAAGLDWKASLTALIGSAWTYAEHDPSDPSSPPANTIRITLPYAPLITPPTGFTLTAGTGGSLAAGTYFYGVTATSPYGETTLSPTQSITVAAGATVTVSGVTGSPGASGYNLYRGPTSTSVGLVTSFTASVVDSGGATSTSPPSTNTTEGFRAGEAQTLARKVTSAHLDVQFGYTSGFLIGVSPIGTTL